MSLYNEPIILPIRGIVHAWVPLDEGGTQNRQGKVAMRCTPLDRFGPLGIGETIREFDFDKLRQTSGRI